MRDRGLLLLYQDCLASHLSAYKRRVLDVHEPGIFRHRGRDIPVDHILPLHRADLNLLPLARRLEVSLGLNVRRHRYFHHLNSSQAFAFNLFLPFFNGGPASSLALLRAMGQAGTVSAWELEAVPSPEEGTNVDVQWVSETGNVSFCEVKLSEVEFGKAKADDRHRRKLETIYRPLLEGHVDQELLEERAFFAAYQILRNVWHAVRVESSTLLFLLPRANARLWEMLPGVLTRLSEPIRSRVHVVAIEDVLMRLRGDQQCPPELRTHADDMWQKYLLPDVPET